MSRSIALAATVHALALGAIYPGYQSTTCLDLTAKPSRARMVATKPDDCRGLIALEAARTRLGDHLPGDANDLWDWCLARSRDELLDVLAYVAATSVNAIQSKSDRRDTPRLVHADALAQALKLDMTAYFTPTAESYFARVSKTQILAAIDEAKGSHAPALDKLKKAELDAINVFARNLKALLLAAPAGPRATMGLDPGLRTGVKVAVVDATGKVVDTAVIYPHQPKNDWDGSLHLLGNLAAKHNVSLISIGNGTASRETDKLAQDLIKQRPELKLTKIVVSEAGASVYSASEFASRELPDMDVSLRGAVSIARRLQDPLAELVKIDPKSIGVGQYQHDVSQTQLARSLDAVVEDCVNAVGVDVNTASAPLLARVSGLSASVAQAIVSYRDMKGAFTSRAALKSVPRLGDKTFEQAAGFLRVMNGDNPLDASAVHPESYPVVEKILADIKKEMKAVIGDASLLKTLNPARYADDKFGVPTITDIIKELEKPGRDPRPEFTTATFKEGVEEISDLRPDMILEGVVTNVAAFGAFVDIGVHQDGLVHISALSNTFVKDPHTVVKAGQVVKVKVLEVDPKRKRIALTMRLTDSAPQAGSKPEQRGDRTDGKRLAQHQNKQPAPMAGSMAAAFAKLKG